MKYTNGFFQLVMREDGTYVHIFPEKAGGKKIVVQEFAEYLDRCGIHEYSLPDLNRAISTAAEEKDIFVSKEKIGEVPETATIWVSENKMMAYVRFYAPSQNGKMMTEHDIRTDLEQANVSYGIIEKVIKAYLAAPQYCRDIPIAKGKMVVPGTDAKISYKFNTTPTAKPQLLEDGSVDFHQLNLFTRVKKGDLLAELTPDYEGEDGVDVFGNVVHPPKVQKKILKYGRNIQISEDKMKIYSEVDGDVKLEDDTVFVSDTYVVPADVDNSTGDIDYNGNVVVTGNVRSGFTVKATGDIQVNGVVEGAIIKAGGNIVLKRGMQGMNKGSLEAGNDIVTKFLESSEAKAGHVINTGSSLHSNLIAGEAIVVSGKKGFLIGGSISAGKKIEASVFGNKMNTATSLHVGVKPEVMDRYKELSVSIKEKQDAVLENRQTIEMLQKKMKEGKKLMPNQLILAKQAGEVLKTLRLELEKEQQEFELIKKDMEAHTNGKIVVNQTMFPGIHIDISNRICQVKDVQNHCLYRMSGASVECIPL